MRSVSTGWALRALVGGLSVLLPAGAWAAVTVDRRPPTTPIAAGGQAGATGLGAAAVLADENPPAPSTTVRVVPPPAVPPPLPGLATTTTRPPAKPATSTTTVAGARTTATLPPGMPWPPPPPPTGVPNIAPATSWQVENQGVRAHLWIEPAAPVAGQAVQFHLDYSSAQACCTVMLDFGDGSPGYGLNTSWSCQEPSKLSPGSHSTVTTHTYAAARAYKATLSVMDKDMCVELQGYPPPTPQVDAVSTAACIAVGPGTAGLAGCSPFPDSGSGTQASPPPAGSSP